MNNSFEQLELMTSELPLDKKWLLIKLLHGQVSGQRYLTANTSTIHSMYPPKVNVETI